MTPNIPDRRESKKKNMIPFVPDRREKNAPAASACCRLRLPPIVIPFVPDRREVPFPKK